MKVVLTINRLEGEKAVLKDSNNKTIIWPREKIPEEFQEGQNIVFDISAGEKNKKENQNKAKDILNEILDIDE